MHHEFKSNIIKNFSETLGSAEQPEVTSFLPFFWATKEFYAILSTMHAYQTSYSIHCTAYSLSMLIFSWNKIILFTDKCIASSLRH